MILIPIVALVIGVLLGAILSKSLPIEWAPYLGVAVLASLDSVFGGTRSQLDGKFQADIFITGFLANIVAALFLVWLGDKIGINLMSAAVIVFGIRIFTNLSLIRRIALTRVAEERERKRREAEQGSWKTEEHQA